LLLLVGCRGRSTEESPGPDAIPADAKKLEIVYVG
jgi:hypothetical protein